MLEGFDISIVLEGFVISFMLEGATTQMADCTNLCPAVSALWCQPTHPRGISPAVSTLRCQPTRPRGVNPVVPALWVSAFWCQLTRACHLVVVVVVANRNLLGTTLQSTRFGSTRSAQEPLRLPSARPNVCRNHVHRTTSQKYLIISSSPKVLDHAHRANFPKAIVCWSLVSTTHEHRLPFFFV
jgi:hypothetical protein